MLQALDKVQKCDETLSLINESISTAHNAAESSLILEQSDEIRLSAARMTRCERLLQLFRGYMRDFSKQLHHLRAEFSTILQTKATQKAAWNRLPDSWWLQHATQCGDMLAKVDEAADNVLTRADIRGCKELRWVRYSDITRQMRSDVGVMAGTWGDLKSYISTWETLGRTVATGVGEHGSML